MRYGSVCSGIEAATTAWHNLGWEASFFSEIDKFPRAVLQHHYPDTSLHGDFTTIGENDYEPIDLLVGGTPCQSFSIAGLRKGLSDDRGNLALEFLKLAGRLGPRWVVWENVPGVLSSNEGRDFGSFLGGLGEIGYGFAYRILDAQYFGVAQRRRRVFVVGYLGDWRPAAAVLFEQESLRGNSAPSREKKANVAALTATGIGTCGVDDNQAQAGHLVAARMTAFGEYECDGTASTVKARDFKDATDLVVHGTQDPIVSSIAHSLGRNSGQENALVSLTPGDRGISVDQACGNMAIPVTHIDGGETARTLSARHDGSPCTDHGPDVVAVSIRGRDGGGTAEMSGPISTALRASQGGGDKSHVLTAMKVRRLTPVECERLQGFPDNFTRIPWRNKPAEQCPDGPRYKALGNSMAVPVMRWIGERIQIVDKMRATA